jgi:hypothetical protein
MGVTFKCNRSGQTVTFTYEHDIKAMREHPDYTEVVETEAQTQSFVQEQPKRGRPRKVVEDTDTDSI